MGKKMQELEIFEKNHDEYDIDDSFFVICLL